MCLYFISQELFVDTLYCMYASQGALQNATIHLAVLNLSVDNPTPFPTDTVTFNCSFLGSSDSNVSFVWMKDGVVVENETQSLFSLNVTFSDNRTMVFCIADGITSDTLTLNGTYYMCTHFCVCV